MLNESVFLSSFDELKNLLLHELTIFHVAIIYILMYVLYKALGRYIYFKPQEHSSKINRTFLTLSLLAVMLHAIRGLANYLPFLPEYNWFFMLCCLIILIAPLSILVDRMIWKYTRWGERSRPDWHYHYLRISNDYYKTSISKEESHGNYSKSWEEEGVESTRENVHSDALLSILALIVFISVGVQWAYESAANYGYSSYIFFIIVCLTITALFLDNTIFSWIYYLEQKMRKTN
jgi:hypothetical protein